MDGTSDSAAPLLELRDASKSYGAVRALRDGNLALRAGEVRALIGENGAGKSTLVKLLGGVIRPDAGEMLVDGEPVDFHSPHARATPASRSSTRSRRSSPTSASPRTSSWATTRSARCGASTAARCTGSVQELLDRLGVRLDPERPVRGLSIADQQIVEIAKALSFDARVLIIDEPTAALSGPEVERLFGVVRTLRERGRRGPLHLAPPGGDLQDLRHRHRHARRRGRARRARWPT